MRGLQGGGTRGLSAWHKGAATALLVLAIARVSGVTSGLDRWVNDAHWRWQAAESRAEFPPQILVVAIDNLTTSKFGRLRYWSRAQYAALLERLSRASAVGIDVLFTEADSRDPRGDAALAEAIRKHGRVALPCYQWRETRPVSRKLLREVQEALSAMDLVDTDARRRLSMVYSHTISTPIPEFAKHASLGLADVNADQDGVYRTPKVALVAEDGRLVPHLSLAVACMAAKTSAARAVGDGTRLRFGARTVPLADGALLLRPVARRGGMADAGKMAATRGFGAPVPTVSFAEALNMPPEKFAGKIVLVGETATGTADIRPNPLDNGLRGVELNAEIVANMLYLRPVAPLPVWAVWVILALAIGVPCYLFEKLEPGKAIVGTVIALVALIGVFELGFWRASVLPPWSTGTLALAAATLSMGLQRYVQEAASKQRLRQSFSVYVAPELVEAIVADPDIAREEGTRRDVAVLFIDIRGFTSYCERNSPEFVVRQMRQYLDEMAAAVDATGGVLDKFIGDCVMALFGPFLPDGANVSARAVRCALEMLERLDRLNDRWEREGMPTFKVGVGINKGEAIVGNIGARRRMQYTALGDTVNLASRLQNATKETGSTLLVSESVKEEAEPDLHGVAIFKALGELTVKGREKQVPVFEASRVVPRNEEASR